MKRLIIRIIKKLATLLYMPGKFMQTSFSQDGEDVVLKGFYEKKKGYKGFYVDVGAHHPFRFSNTYSFYRKGWRGINLDPTPGTMKLFKKYRKRDINLEIAVGNSNEALTYYLFNEPALNGFNEEMAKERHQAEGIYRIIEKKKIVPQSLEKILDDYLPENTEIDFLDIDVEGYDYEVLLSNNWDKYKPKFIFVETELDFENLKSNKIHTFLFEKGYRLKAKTKRNLIYKHNI